MVIQDTLQSHLTQPPDTIFGLGWPGIIAIGLLLLAGVWLVFISRGRNGSGPDDKGAA